MDPSVLHTDDQTQSRSAPTDTPTGESNSFPCCPTQSHSPTEKPLSGHETAEETLSDPSDTSTEIYSNASRNLSQDTSSDSGCLKPLSCSSNMSEHFPLCSEPAPKADEFRDGCYFSPRKHVLPLLPHLSCNLISPLSQPSGFYVKESALSFSTIQDNSTPQLSGVMSSTSEDVMEPFIAEPCFGHSSDHSQVSNLSRSLSHQSDSLGSDTAAAPMSDLYIYESETQDFILSPNVDPEEIKCAEYLTLSQTEGENMGHDCDMHDLLCDSGNVVTQCHPGNSESGWSQHAGQQTPAADACEAGWQAVSDATAVGKTEITDLSLQSQRSISPVELWLDACQYLTGEDAEERASHSGMQRGLGATSHLSFSVTETQVSGYRPDGNEGIGQSGSDTIGWGPPVERWSSVDSWASALSDWAGIIAAPSEDFTAAFTAAGAEIDALTKALAEGNPCLEPETCQGVKVMGVQDQPLKTQNIPESSVLSEPSCLSLCLETSRPEFQQSLHDTTPTTRGDKGRGETLNSRNELSLCSPYQQTSVGSSDAMLASPGDADVTSASTYSADLDIFINNEEDPIILTIIEDTDLEGEHAPAQLIFNEPFADGLCEVTDERAIAQPGSVAAQKAEGSFGLGEINRKGTKLPADFFAPHSLTDSHVPVVDRQPGPRLNVHTHVPSDPLLDFDGACQLEPQWGSPKFITPLAPLGIDSSLICQARSSLEAAQTYAKRSHGDNRDFSRDPVQTWDHSPGLDDVTDKSSSEGDDELIHKTGSAVDSSNSSPPDGCGNLWNVETSQSSFTVAQTIIEDINDLSRELSHLAVIPGDFTISEENRVAFATLDLNDPFAPRVVNLGVKSAEAGQKPLGKMPHKTHKSSSESKPRSKKDKSSGHHHGAQASLKQENLSHHVQQLCKKQETHPPVGEHMPAGLDNKETKLVIETTVATEKASAKSHGKKKKKHAQGATGGRGAGEPLAEVENGAKPKAAKGRIDMFEAKLAPKAGKAQKDNDLAHVAEKISQQPEVKPCQAEQPPHHTVRKDHQPKNLAGPVNDDIIKRPRLSGDKFGKIVSALESKLPKQDVSIQPKQVEAKLEAGATRKKAYSEVVKQKVPPKEEPKVVKPIQAVALSGDPQSLSLWCQFAAVFSHHTVTWSRDGTVLSEIKRSAGDESRVSLTVSNASHKDLGKYQCHLSSSHGSVSLDYVLTYEVLSEIVIPPTPKVVAVAPVEGGTEEEDVHCSRLLFKDDFLSDQYFGEEEPASILTEKVHFGEGMHRRAFRTKLQAGQIPLLLPGHPCVLKVHNVISVGTKNNEELVQKNFTLAVEECQVQNTAREYIKAYTTVAQSVESFGSIPEIIPIYLVHRPSNDIPYATLEEELIGDFVKYSVKDGKELNLLRRDSEAGQKCCAFQHWVYHKTEGNLLVTDMQGVGMRLTDVGIATCKKGYKGFKGNCATSFIDQFKALHQCNRYCEILGLKSLQPKPRKAASVPKPKPQPSAAPKKKTFGPTLKSKS